MSYERLEYHAGTDDAEESLAARVADPLWFLARQRQVGELVGEDAGSPLRCRLVSEQLPFVAAGPRGGVRPLRGAPPEAALQAEPIATGPSGLRHAIDRGLSLLRALSLADLGAVRSRLKERFPIRAGSQRGDPGGALLQALARGSVDARAVRLSVEAHGVGDLVEGVEGVDVAKVEALWAAWLAEDGGVLDAPEEPEGWAERRLAYEGVLVAGRGPRRVRLALSAHEGGALRWHDLEVLDERGDPELQPEQRGVPTTVAYPGQPTQRWWTFEDADVHFGGLEGALDDAAAALIGAFATALGDDWFQVPLRVEGQALLRVHELVVEDTFGQRHTVPAAQHADGGSRPFRLFELATAAGESSDWLPVLGPRDRLAAGPALEEVVFTRDEAANVAWAIERSVEAPSGRSRGRTGRPTSDGAGWRWRLQPLIGDHQIPFVPVPEGEGSAEMVLRRGRMQSWSAAQGPQGRVLRPERALWIEEEVVPAEGIAVRRHFLRARDADGRVFSWVGRKVDHEPTPPTPELAFDRLQQ